jgi:hypothetical protein
VNLQNSYGMAEGLSGVPFLKGDLDSLRRSLAASFKKKQLSIVAKQNGGSERMHQAVEKIKRVEQNLAKNIVFVHS